MAESSATFQTIIRAVDEASAPLRSIAAHVKGLAPTIDAISPHVHGMHQVFAAALGSIGSAEKRTDGEFRKLSPMIDAIKPHVEGMREVFAAAFRDTDREGEHTAGELHKTGEAARKAGHEIAHAAHTHVWEALAGHITLVRGHFGELGTSIGETGGKLGELLPALGALGAVGSVAGLFETVEHTSEAFSELSKQAAGAGMSVIAFQNISAVAQMADVPVETMSQDLFRLNRVMGDAAAGKNKDAAALFAHLHISLRDASGAARTASELMPQLADAFAHTSDKTMQARMAMALFGREGMEILPLLTQGREELDKLSTLASKLNFTPDKQQQENLENYHKSLVGMSFAAHGFMLEISTKLAPVLQPVVEMATNWMLANRDWITTGIAEHVGHLARWVDHLDIKRIVTDTMAWARKAKDLADNFGGIQTVLGAIVLIKMVGWANPFLSVIKDLNAALWGTVAAIKAVDAAIADSAIAKVIRAVGPVAAAPVGFAYGMWPAPTQTTEYERAGMAQYFKEHPKLKAPSKSLAPPGMPAGPTTQMPKPFWPALNPNDLLPINPWAPNYLSPAQRIEAARTQLAEPHQPEFQETYRRLDTTPPRRLPALYGPRASSAPQPLVVVPDGSIKVKITAHNLPPGTTVTGTATGIVDAPDVDVGYTMGLPGSRY